MAARVGVVQPKTSALEGVSVGGVSFSERVFSIPNDTKRVAAGGGGDVSTGEVGRVSGFTATSATSRGVYEAASSSVAVTNSPQVPSSGKTIPTAGGSGSKPNGVLPGGTTSPAESKKVTVGQGQRGGRGTDEAGVEVPAQEGLQRRQKGKQGGAGGTDGDEERQRMDLMIDNLRRAREFNRSVDGRGWVRLIDAIVSRLLPRLRCLSVWIV